MAQSDLTHGLDLLVQSARNVRPVEGRLTGGFDYAPIRLPVDGAPRSQSSNETDQGMRLFAEAAARITADVAANPSPANLHAQGILRLFWGKPEEAVGSLEQARARDPKNAKKLNDLAVARLALARARDEPYGLLDVLVTADKAVEADNYLPEARFNRALALESLYLDSDAREAWQAYLELDPKSAWADEAREHLANLTPHREQAWDSELLLLKEAISSADETLVHKTVSRFPQQARVFVEQELLPEWAEAWRRQRKTEAAKILDISRAMGDALVSLNGDLMIQDAVEAIDATQWRSDGPKLESLSDGLSHYSEAVKLFRSFETTAAEAHFQQARVDLQSIGDFFVNWVDLYLANCANQKGQYSRALDLIEPLVQKPEMHRYPNLLGRIHWALGYTHHVEARPTSALKHFRAALKEFEKLGEVENVAFLNILISEGLEFLGQTSEAWKYRHRALSATRKSISPRRTRIMLFSIAETANKEDRAEIALYFQNAALRIAQSATTTTPLALAEAYWRRSVIFLRLGRLEQSKEDLHAAREHCRQIKDVSIRGRIESSLQLAEAELVRDNDPRRAIALLSFALESFKSSSYDYLLTDLYLTRARAYLSADRPELAEADLRSGIEEVERQRRGVSGSSLRVSYLDKVEALFSQMILFQAKVGRTELSFDYSERARARALLDNMALSAVGGRSGIRPTMESATPMNSASIREALPATVVLIEYMVFEDRLLTWVVSPSSMRLIETPISAAVLGRLIEQFRTLIESRTVDPSFSSTAHELYEILLGPAIDYLPEESRLIFIPHGILNHLPFAALKNRRSGRFVIQERTIGVTPSATFYVNAMSRLHDVPQSSELSALVVANPYFERQMFPRLPNLPDAESVGTSIANTYSRSEFLSREAATKTRFFEKARQHPIVHFGGHAISNPRFPFLSHMLLAPDEKGADLGVLYAREVYDRRFDNTRLVVLAACRSASGFVSRTEGIIGLASSFLAAGVPGVIASLWDVDDHDTAKLFAAVHRRIQKGMDATEALRQAQLELLDSSDPFLRSPAAWAAFVHIGAGITSEEALTVDDFINR